LYPDNTETFLRIAGDFRVIPKPSCASQGTFGWYRNLPAHRRGLSGDTETFPRIAGDFQMFPKPSCRSRGGFGKQMPGCNSNWYSGWI